MRAAVLLAGLSALALAPAQAAARERPVTFRGGGGTQIAGALTLPDRPGPHPAAVLVSGFGPNDRDGVVGGFDGRPYRRLAEDLTRRGVAVLRYDKRGTGASGGGALAWLDPRPITADAAAALTALRRARGVDPRRVSLVGHSQGGGLALRVARSAPVRSVVTIGAPGRPLTRVAGVGESALRLLVGDSAARAALARNPLRDAAAVRAPLLVAHGTADPVVPVADARRIVRARRAAGRPTALLAVPGGGHNLHVDARIPAAALDRIAARLRA
jgi:hypothetical protein